MSVTGSETRSARHAPRGGASERPAPAIELLDSEPGGECPAERFGRIPEGMNWCPQCNGYGSSLKEASGRCTHCGGSGLVWADRERPIVGRNGKPSARL
jgi:hypothetical protein